MDPSPRPAADDTVELLRRGAGGDRDALDRVFSLHSTRLRRMIQVRLDRRLRRRVDEDDVLQEVYLDASRRLSEFLAAKDRAVPFFIWLRFLTGQKLIDLHRHHFGVQARDVRREKEISWGPMPAANSAAIAARLLGTRSTPSEKLMRAELKRKIQDALDTMDARDREVLVLRHYENLTHSEIAHELGLDRSATSKRYIRALSRIKRILDGALDDTEHR